MLIFETPFGSHLFGTNTPSSDYDYKGVYIPEWHEIIAPKIPDVRQLGTGTSNTKNTSEDVDREHYAVHKYFDMLAKGDMIATEMLFAPYNGSETHHWYYIQYHKEQLISRQCKGFVGYVQRQANTYGVKGERLNEVDDMVEFLSEYVTANPNGKFSDVPDFEETFKKFCEGRKFTSWIMLPNAHKEYFHMVCCDRKVPTTVTFKEAFWIYDNVLQQYGKRARAAATNNGVDWKAISHAIRIGEEAIELLQTGNITFPRPNAERLLNIKLGNENYEKIAEELEYNLREVEYWSDISDLPDFPDQKIMKQLTQDFYLAQIRGH